MRELTAPRLLACLLTSWLGAGCAPAVPARSPSTSPLSPDAPAPAPPEVATSLTRDPLAELPDAGPTSPADQGHQHDQHQHDQHDQHQHHHHSGGQP